MHYNLFKSINRIYNVTINLFLDADQKFGKNSVNLESVNYSLLYSLKIAITKNYYYLKL